MHISRIGLSLLKFSKACTTLSCHYATQEGIKRTALYNFHVSLGAKIVPFAGWEMPVQYQSTISDEHLQVRNSVGIFDVSHMLQTHITGPDRHTFMESMVVGDIKGLKENSGTLTVFTNDSGGILDDLIVSNAEGYLYVVSNAGCSDKDWAHLTTVAKDFRKEGKNVHVERNINSLIAVQGPLMAKVLKPLVDFDLSTLPFMTTREGTVCGVPECRITRCGYTGEDGVEISVPSKLIEKVVTQLLSSKVADVKMIGLGARDSLRLEAGLCLYGSDIDETTNPVEASLTWLIGKSRRAQANFPGAKVILEQIASKPTRRRVGFLSTGPPARGGAIIYDEAGNKVIGKVTSGCPSPSLKKNVAMGYVEADHTKIGTPVKFEIRKKMYEAVISKMPFVPSKYFIPK